LFGRSSDTFIQKFVLCATVLLIVILFSFLIGCVIMADSYIGDEHSTGLPRAAAAKMGGMKMMHIHVEQIPADGLDFRFEESPQEFPVLAEMINRGECEFLAPIKTSLRAVRIADRVEVEGDVRSVVGLPCARCLKVFETALTSRFALTYTNRLEEMEMAADQDEVELRPEEINRIYFQGETINLQDAIQEQVIMAFPIRALCSEGCRGLCPQCGADLNEGDCGCSRRLSDSRFASLKNFRPRKT
jgi:DUF177 domain-containing protein